MNESNRILDQDFQDENEQACRVCGCTWTNACPGGCYWVEQDLCSSCAYQDKKLKIGHSIQKSGTTRISCSPNYFQ